MSSRDSADASAPERVTYVTVASRRFFPGAVAMLNSLRLTGNHGDAVVLDWSLLPQQRAVLAREAEIVPVGDVPNPMLAKAAVARLGLRGSVVVLDSDLVVCGSLEPVLARVRAGGICLFPDHVSKRAKWYAEWEELFGLAARPRRQTYGNAGFVALSAERHARLLERWWEACLRLWEDRPAWVDAPDQDALNALLMSEVPADALELLPEWEGPLLEHLDDVEVLDERTLSAVLGGRPTRVLHYVLAPKPWDGRGWIRVRNDAYVRLLLRCLWGDDVPLRLAHSDVPAWLKPGRAGQLARAALTGAHEGAAAAVRRTPPRLRRRLLAARDRVVS